ncbi:MAG TPA: rhomboid family intramembrane serine protease, partial [Aggregatilineales bacterium]|nr:rhomboid family intramembrane serine protease [Aggregatilineales bacterium]
YELTLSDVQLNTFCMNWGTVPNTLLAAFANPGAANSMHAFLTLITSQFIHGGWAHILGNMLFLYIFGDDIEDTLGSGLYLVFYLVCGVAAGLAQTFVLAHMMDSLDVPSIGASGAIAGVLGAYLILYPDRRITVLGPLGGLGTVSALVVIGLWFAEQLVAGLGALTPEAGDSIAYWAHVGGFVSGIILILPFKDRVYRQPKGIPPIWE